MYNLLNSYRIIVWGHISLKSGSFRFRFQLSLAGRSSTNGIPGNPLAVHLIYKSTWLVELMDLKWRSNTVDSISLGAEMERYLSGDDWAGCVCENVSQSRKLLKKKTTILVFVSRFLKCLCIFFKEISVCSCWFRLLMLIVFLIGCCNFYNIRKYNLYIALFICIYICLHI